MVGKPVHEGRSLPLVIWRNLVVEIALELQIALGVELCRSKESLPAKACTDSKQNEGW